MTLTHSDSIKPARRSWAIVILAVLFLFIGLIWIGMALQNFAWDEYKPGKPMDPDLVPWSIGLILLGSAYLLTSIGLLRMRRWGRACAFLMGGFFVGLAVYGYSESSLLLPILFIPGLVILIGLIYLAQPRMRERFF